MAEVTGVVRVSLPAAGSTTIAAMSGHTDRPESESFSVEGVDLTLIRWLLELTPAERLLVLESNIRSLGTLRGAAARR